jgi:hypothetical protein
MPLMNVEKELYRRARELIGEGRLPLENVKTYGGPGSGDACSLCSRPIAPDEVEYEVESRSGGEARNFRLHLPCHAAWRFECARTHRRTETA